MRERHFQYMPSQTPWNNRILLTIWCIQLIPSIIVSSLGAGLMPSKLTEYRSDDGLSVAFYMVSTLIACSATIMTMGLTLFQVLQWRKNALHPMWMVIMSSCMTPLWLVVIGMGGAALQFSSPIFMVYEASILLDCLAGIPYIAGLVYSSIVFAKWKKTRKVNVDVDIQSLESTRPLASS